MKIAYDALATSRNMTGSCRYYRNVIKLICRSRPEWIIENWVHSDNGINYSFTNPNYRQHLLGNWCSKRPLRILYEQTRLGGNINNVKPDLYHGNGFIPAGIKCPSVVTIHDMSYFCNPERTTFLRSCYFREFTKIAAKKASLILTDSNTSKADIIKYIPETADKIRVIYIAVEDYFKPIKDNNRLKEFRKKYNLQNKYFLYLGTLEPGKNIVRLINAYVAAESSEKFGVDLVIAGKKGWLFDEIFQTAEKTGLLNKKIFFLDYIPEFDLPLLYNAAECLIFPSLNEGFGLPPLEAMSCGTPVITSNISSLPEIFGDSAILIDPYDENQIAESMIKIIKDTALKNELVSKGLERAKLYSWDNTINQILNIYEQLIK